MDAADDLDSALDAAVAMQDGAREAAAPGAVPATGGEEKGHCGQDARATAAAPRGGEGGQCGQDARATAGGLRDGREGQCGQDARATVGGPRGGEGGRCGQDARATVDFREYVAPDGELWRVDEWAGMEEALDGFRADEAGLAEWHRAFAGTVMFGIFRRRFVIAPVLAETGGPEDFREIGKALGLAEAEVRRQMEHAAVYWRQCLAAKAGPALAGPVAAPSPDDDGDDGLIPEGKVTLLLRSVAMSYVTDGAERQFVAERVLVWRPRMEDAEAAEIVKRVVSHELRMNQAAKELYLAEREPPGKRTAKDVGALAKALADLDSEYRAMIGLLGASPDKKDNLATRLGLRDCASEIVEAFRNYHADEDNALIDGMFKAAELRVLIRPVKERPCQYRADVVVARHSDYLAANLWNRDYRAESLSREVCRRLRAGFAAGLERVLDDEGVDLYSLEEERELENNALAESGVTESEAHAAAASGSGMDEDSIEAAAEMAALVASGNTGEEELCP